MGCFSGDVTRVANTRIFARATEQGTQILVVQLDYAADTDIALIVPLPTPQATATDGVKFIDLATYPDFFGALQGGFPIARSGPPELPSTSAVPARGVGTLNASFLPSRADFANLESQYRIPDEVWDQLPEYSDYGFAVIKLSADAHTVPPMALDFPMRDPHLLYFPTVSIQKNTVPENAYFDHDLFCQSHVGWMRSYDTARSFMDTELVGNVIDPNFRVERFTVLGIHPNSDIVLNLAHDAGA